MSDAATAVPDAAAAPLVLEHREGEGILVLTLNRPGARNALSLDLMRSLSDGLDRAGRDASVKVVLLAANGPAFSAGHDLKELTRHRSDADGGRAFFDETMTTCSNLMQAIVRSPKPVIAVVEGIATAAGCQLVASCDLAVAAETATFATPGVNIGLFCSTPMVALSRNVSRKRAMEMLLLGETLSAYEAVDWGLINRAAPEGEVMARALEYARAIVAKSSKTVAIGKEAFYAQADMALADAYAYATRVMVENMLIEDAKEGIGAFIEKRTPNWKGC